MQWLQNWAKQRHSSRLSSQLVLNELPGVESSSSSIMFLEKMIEHIFVRVHDENSLVFCICLNISDGKEKVTLRSVVIATNKAWVATRLYNNNNSMSNFLSSLLYTGNLQWYLFAKGDKQEEKLAK